MGWLLHWLAVHTGTVNEPGPYYGFWSGFGSDLGEVALLGGLFAMVRTRKCEVHRCWRIGRHTTAAGHRACRKHHPDGHLTEDRLHRAHHDAIAKKSDMTGGGGSGNPKRR